MKPSFLSTTVLALAHNVELNKAGWNTRALERLLLGALWIEGGPTPVSGLGKLLESSFSVSSSEREISPIVARLVSAGTLTLLPAGKVRLSSEGSRYINSELEGVEADEKAAREAWERCLLDQGLAEQATWTNFQEKLLGPLVLEQGAGTYRVFTGEAPEWNRRLVEDLAQTDDPDVVRGLKLAVDHFLASHDDQVRSYLLRSLRAHLSWQAGQLPSKVLEQVIDGTALQPRFRLFLDTNFVFSMLDLHANPANDAADALFALLAELPERVDVKFYVLPITSDEMKRVLMAQKFVCAGLRLTPSLAASALEADSLSGVMKRYVERSQKAGASLSASDYFDPYLDDITTVLRQKGVELYNASMSKWTQRQDVIDDILHIQGRLDRGNRPKSYEQIEHDAVLWHVVDDLRPEGLESPIAADAWVVSIDYRLLGFDGYKHRTTREQPVCIHPTNLVQLLSFWLPRSGTLDKAMIECLRLPFLFEEFDREAESVTLRILRTLGRFENLDDLSEETSLSLLVNRALRDRLSSATSEDGDVELIREALLEDNTELRNAVEGAKLQRADADRVAAEAKAEADRLKEKVTSLSENLRDVERIQSERDVLKAKVSKLEERKTATEAAIETLSTEMQSLRASQRRSTFLRNRLIAIPTLGAVAGGFGGHFIAPLVAGPPWLMPLLLGAGLLALTGAASCRLPVPPPELASWPVLAIYRRVSGWLLGTVVGGLLVSILSSFLTTAISGF